MIWSKLQDLCVPCLLPRWDGGVHILTSGDCFEDWVFLTKCLKQCWDINTINVSSCIFKSTYKSSRERVLKRGDFTICYTTMTFSVCPYSLDRSLFWSQSEDPNHHVGEVTRTRTWGTWSDLIHSEKAENEKLLFSTGSQPGEWYYSKLIKVGSPILIGIV